MTSVGCDIEVLALASIPGMYPMRLHHILKWHTPIEGLEILRRRGRFHPATERRIRRSGIEELFQNVERADPQRLIEASRSAGVGLLTRSHPDYPAALQLDPEAPEVLYYLGDLSVLKRRRVGIVGTRNATAAGRATATELGLGLAEADVSVVSGLALGIDAAAHVGARQAGSGHVAAVVGSGLDVPYPKRNRALWEWVGHNGVLLSEYEPGAQPEGWRFPLRNRIIAGLSEVLVVVESRAVGGSLITVDAALERGVTVMAVPGSRYCESAVGTNELLKEGANIATCVDDVLTMLGITHLPDDAMYQGQLEFTRFDPVGRTAEIVAQCSGQPSTVDDLAALLDCDVMDVAKVVARLEHGGLLRDSNGWFEGVDSRLGRIPSDWG